MIGMNSNQKKKIYVLRSSLLRKGMTLAGFARANEFSPVTVRDVVRRHYGRDDIEVRGVLTRAILDKLEAATNNEN
jgi:lambda repressor-like predicted transcriptional regulator